MSCMDVERATHGVGQPRLEKFRLNWDWAAEDPLEPPPGRVLFEDKTAPVEDRPLRSLSGTAEPYAFLRGTCDVGPLQRRLERDARVWSDEFAAERNVAFARPSHDAWGIKKLAFVFCDDFLQRVYRLPLWEDPEWRALLDPVFECCGVPRDRVVRCLLASMPPSTVIPPHHDSGYWVPRTHRLHVAIRTFDDVVFRVGRTAKTLRRVKFSEGSVVELNNQAKHHVANLAGAFRTHLIFDYVDDAAEPELLPPRMPVVALRVGDRLEQTRRSIALARERGTGPPAPHFLILGAQKAGTTSMYDYLNQHPLMIRGARRETHFLDWRWDPALRGASAAARWHAAFFDAEAHAEHPDLRACDSTPSYLLQSNLAIPRLASVRPFVKTPCVAMVRDPARRAASHHAMIADKDATPAQRRTRGAAWLGRTLRDVAEAELADLVERGVFVAAAAPAAAAGPPRLDAAYDLDAAALAAFLPSLPIGHGAHSLLLRGCYAAQLRPWFAALGRDAVLVERCEDMETPAGAAAAVRRAQAHVGLRDHPLDDASPKNARAYAPPDASIDADLRAFYAPMNADLYALLAWDDPDRRW